MPNPSDEIWCMILWIQVGCVSDNNLLSFPFVYFYVEWMEWSCLDIMGFLFFLGANFTIKLFVIFCILNSSVRGNYSIDVFERKIIFC